MPDAGKRQSWTLPQRTPIIAAAGLLALIVTLLLLAGWFYRERLEPGHRQPVTTFPAPGVETEIHDGTEDPTRPPSRRPVDPVVEAAKRAVVRDGIAGWSAGR